MVVLHLLMAQLEQQILVVVEVDHMRLNQDHLEVLELL
jgi:hypothetical protein